jgi:hypothetical protein
VTAEDPLSLVWTPFRGVAPHVSDAKGRWFAWICDPPGIFDYVAPGQKLDDDYAAFLEGPVTDLANRIHGDKTRLLFMHDWRQVRDYTISVRARLVRWGLSSLGRERIQAITCLLADDASPMIKMAVAVGGTMMAAAGVDLRAKTTAQATSWEAELRPHR